MKKNLLLTAALFLASFGVQAQDYVITKYKVSTDSNQVNTKAIQKVIDMAAAKGGGTIVIPKGTYLTGALFFKPETKLRLLQGAKLKGSDNIDDYPLIPSRMEGRRLDYYAAVINATNVNGFTITGPGTIDGNGLKYWKTFWAHRDSMKRAGKSSTNLEVHRPRLVFLWGCNNVNIKNVKLHNSGFWTTHLYQCTNVLIDGCDIRSPYQPVPAPSTDGIDIDVCRKVRVRNCFISVNDDAVCIKGGKGPTAHKMPENGPVEDILVDNCTFGESHGTLTIGSESIHAQRITLRNCKVDNLCPLLRIKMRPDTYQTFENITVSNITGRCGTLIDLNPWKQFFDLGGSTETPYGQVHNITFSDINVDCTKFGTIDGNPNDKIGNITFKNIKLTADNPALACRYPDVKVENVVANGKPLIIKK